MAAPNNDYGQYGQPDQEYDNPASPPPQAQAHQAVDHGKKKKRAYAAGAFDVGTGANAAAGGRGRLEGSSRPPSLRRPVTAATPSLTPSRPPTAPRSRVTASDSSLPPLLGPPAAATKRQSLTTRLAAPLPRRAVFKALQPGSRQCNWDPGHSRRSKLLPV